jgi:hypothetical protein
MVKTCAGCVDVSTCVKDQRAKGKGCKFYLEQNSFLSKKEPIQLCSKCKHPTCVKSGKLCRKVERLLPKLTSGRINSKEFSTDNIEMVYNAFKGKESGWRKKMPEIDD